MQVQTPKMFISVEFPVRTRGDSFCFIVARRDFREKTFHTPSPFVGGSTSEWFDSCGSPHQLLVRELHVLTDLTFLFFCKTYGTQSLFCRCDMGLSSLGLCSLEQGSKGSSSQADRAGVACRWGTPWTIYVAFSPELRRKLL